MHFHKMDIKEHKIPVPWGHVAVKAWGNEKDTPILMVHGFRDNAGSFDRLIPYLPTTFYYICIDLPGHGRSSHFPPHLLVHTINNIFTYKLVMDYLNRKKYIIIGHSWGGQMGLFFTQLYPDYVTKLIILDGVNLFPISLNDFKQYMKLKFEQITQINQKIATKTPPTYTYKEALKRLNQGRIYGELTTEAAEALLKRSLIEIENGKFKFSGDIRVASIISVLYGKQFLDRFTKDYPVACPILFIMASDSMPILQYFRNIMKEMQKNNKCFIRKVEGDHNVHMNQPEMVAPIIIAFLGYRSKL